MNTKEKFNILIQTYRSSVNMGDFLIAYLLGISNLFHSKLLANIQYGEKLVISI